MVMDAKRIDRCRGWLLAGVAMAALVTPMSIGVVRADQLEDAIACEAASCGGGATCQRWAGAKVKRFMQLETVRVAGWRRNYGAGSRVPAAGNGYWFCGTITGLTGEHVAGDEDVLDASRARDVAMRKAAGY
jgi:hypothetical protein